MKKKIKSSHDACKAIVEMTQSYYVPPGSPEDKLIHELYTIAAAGIKADTAAEEAEDAVLERLIKHAEQERRAKGEPFEELKLQ